jgi:Zn-dependent protease
MATPSREWVLGDVGGLRMRVIPQALVGSLGLLAVLFIIGSMVLGLGTIPAAIGALLGVCIHWFSELWHNLGHAWAARRTGWPMTGVRFGVFGVLAQSLYPPDEPELPGRVHITRALGGPAASAMLALICGALAWATAGSGLPGWLALFAFAINLLIYTLMAFLPLPWLDGGTILRWRGK